MYVSEVRRLNILRVSLPGQQTCLPAGQARKSRKLARQHPGTGQEIQSRNLIRQPRTPGNWPGKTRKLARQQWEAGLAGHQPGRPCKNQMTWSLRVRGPMQLYHQKSRG